MELFPNQSLFLGFSPKMWFWAESQHKRLCRFRRISPTDCVEIGNEPKMWGMPGNGAPWEKYPRKRARAGSAPQETAQTGTNHPFIFPQIRPPEAVCGLPLAKPGSIGVERSCRSTA